MDKDFNVTSRSIVVLKSILVIAETKKPPLMMNLSLYVDFDSFSKNNGSKYDVRINI